MPHSERQLVATVRKVLANFDGHSAGTVAKERQALDQAMDMQVLRIRFELALEEQLRALAGRVVPPAERLAGQRELLHPARGQVEDVLLLLLAFDNAAGFVRWAALLLKRGINVVRGGLLLTRHGQRVHEYVLPILVHVQVVRNVHRVLCTLLHVYPVVFVVPDRLDTQVWAAVHVVQPTGGRLHKKALVDHAFAGAHEDPAVYAPALKVIRLHGIRLFFVFRLGLALHVGFRALGHLPQIL
mmetsp:Transcript_10299/g.32793  ORF Transcript_10299/g.32793 Transcript_10299/m.32793 type:complete len:242 (-) Transcript_10299:1134-1859(-)